MSLLLLSFRYLNSQRKKEARDKKGEGKKKNSMKNYSGLLPFECK
jgi:hypothetical protein